MDTDTITKTSVTLKGFLQPFYAKGGELYNVAGVKLSKKSYGTRYLQGVAFSTDVLGVGSTQVHTLSIREDVVGPATIQKIVELMTRFNMVSVDWDNFPQLIEVEVEVIDMTTGAYPSLVAKSIKILN